ncbi:PAS domain-containing protein [Pseudoduganella lurida]|uniref:histidine kinase n=1 Tax=Pseudoduganella lurida TaxID=1036180 RepID=A0A562RB99_9BURK|nr:ATP-binding protein [Pseudoduganella lurida]TWI66193.1 PAS domain-containing protein [Pseudoduganella lurida]
MFDASPNPYLLLDRELNIAWANRTYLLSTRRELDDIVGRWAWDAFPTDPETLKQAVTSFQRVIRTGKTDTMALLRFDIPRPAAEGGGQETRYWSITHSPVFGADGSVEYVLQHPIDVTELERLREATRGVVPLALVPEQTGIFARAQDVYETNLSLNADIDRLQMLFQQAPSFMAVLRGPDHVYELVNDAITELMGARDYVGKTVREAVPEADQQGFVAMLDEVYRTGKPFVAYGMPASFRRGPDEALTECFMNFIYQPIIGRDGTVEGIFVEGTDVTEQYLAHRKVEETLRQEARHKDEFLAMLSHELRNPLAPIGTAAELLALGKLDAAGIHRVSTVIRRQIGHITGLVNDLLDVSRVTRGLVTLDSLPTPMAAVVQDALEQVTPMLEARQHRVDVQLPDVTAVVAGDRKRLVQVVANLLSNAAKYTPDHGHVQVTLALDDARIVLTVTDNGIGMSAQLQANAFQLFTQATPTPDRAQGGLGIGLALVKHIVELHHGTVAVHSAGAGRGSVFTVTLPRLPHP